MNIMIFPANIYYIPLDPITLNEPMFINGHTHINTDTEYTCCNKVHQRDPGLSCTSLANFLLEYFTLIVKYRSGYSRNSETHMLGSFLLGKSVNSGAVLAGTRIGFGPRHCIGNINLASLPYKSHINQNCPAKLVPLLEFLFPHTRLIFEAKLP